MELPINEKLKNYLDEEREVMNGLDSNPSEGYEPKEKNGLQIQIV